MEKITIGALIVLFIGITVALAIIPDIANYQKGLTDKNSASNETFNIAASRLAAGAINASKEIDIVNENTGWNIANCPITNFVLRNQSGDTLTINTHYRFTPAYGNVTLINHDEINTSTKNVTAVDYTYCPDAYVGSAGGRGIAGIILLLAALGLVVFAVYYATRFYSER